MNDATDERIRSRIAGCDVMLYMKGSPLFPQDGFSARVVQILHQLGVSFQSDDILQDPALRDGLKTFSSSSKIPQLYVKGELVGDGDAVAALYESGELQKFLAKRGVPVKT